MEKEIKQPGKAKRFFKRLGIALLLAGGYSLFFSQFNTNLINELSQKKSFIVGIDFEAYKKSAPLEITIKRKGDETADIKNKQIENWSYFSDYQIQNWWELSYSNALGFTPYYGNIHEKEKINEIIESNDETLEGILKMATGDNIIVLKIKDEAKDYENLKENDPLTFVAERVARRAVDYGDRAIIELEAPDDGDYEAHNRRINMIRKQNPMFKVAVTLDKKEGYDEKTGLWNPEKSKGYWGNADIIILEDYFSKPGNLEESIKKFKNATMNNKQVWVRIVVGSKRINEKNMASLEAELEEYERVMEVVKEYADGCLANDTNGIWLFSENAYDKKERLNRTKQLYKKFRGIKVLKR